MTTLVPGEEQRVQYLIDSIDSVEQAIQATIGLIRNNMNEMRSSFEKSASALIDVDPFVKGRNRGHRGTANISSLEYTERGGSGVDLRWHTPSEYRLLSKELKDELHQWQQSAAGKEVINKSKEEYQSRKKGKGKGKNVDTPKKRKKWLSKYAKQPIGRAHIMSLLAKVNDDDMDVDGATGNVAAVNAWPPIDLGRGNQVGIPAGFYTPRQLRKEKKELKDQLMYKKTLLNSKISKPMLTKPTVKAPILKGPRTSWVKFADTLTNVTLQSILDKSS